MVLTIAVKVPAAGFVDRVTVREVDVAAVTVPTAPLLNTTVLLPGVVLNPVPAMVTVANVANSSVELLVTTGRIVPTWTALPLLTLFRVTIAVRLPAVRVPEKVTVNAVAVAAVTVPTLPLLNSTVLLLGVAASNPKPLMFTVAAVRAKLAVLLVTTGTTFATASALPLFTEFVVTTAVNSPREVGLVVNLTVSAVAVAAVTFPIAPRLKTTVLFAAVVSKPKPRIVTVSALTAELAMLVVTTGLMVAT